MTRDLRIICGPASKYVKVCDPPTLGKETTIEDRDTDPQ